MDIYINNKKIDYQLEKEKTIGEVLGSLESQCEKANMTITAIHVDGSSIPADKLDELFAKTPDSISKIELKTISGNDILIQIKETGLKFTECVPFLLDIPVQLQTGKDLIVMQTINRFSENLQELYQLIPLLSITGLTEQRLMIDGISLSSFPAHLAPLLSDLLSAMEKKDTVLVGDLSEYELAPKIEKLGAILSAVC